jgi:Resolvase, N terminal domain
VVQGINANWGRPQLALYKPAGRSGPLGPSVVRGIGVIACYCRVSSASQKTDSQKPEIRRWLDGNRIDPSTVGWFEDKESGKTLRGDLET